jgi:hypothetical protein
VNPVQFYPRNPGLNLDPGSTFEHLLLMNTVNPVQFYPRNPGINLDPGTTFEHFLLMNAVNPVKFYPRNPGLNLDPGSTNSSRITPLVSEYRPDFMEVFLY